MSSLGEFRQIDEQMMNDQSNKDSDAKNQKIAAAAQGLQAILGGGQSSGGNTSTSGGVASGAASGAMTGATFGPYGAAVGAVVGGGMGALKARSARKRQEQELENKKQLQLANIESNKSANINNAIANMATRLSAAFRVPTFNAFGKKR